MRSSTATDAVRASLASQRSQLLVMIRLRAGTGLEAEEVLQAASLKALSQAHQLSDPTKAHAWVRQVVRRQVIDEFRRRRVASPLPLDGHDVAQAPDDSIDCTCVFAQAKLLASSHSEILKRVVIDGVPVSRVAGELGITVNNAMVRLHRARAALKVRLEAHCGTTTARSCSECGCEERGCCPETDDSIDVARIL